MKLSLENEIKETLLGWWGRKSDILSKLFRTLCIACDVSLLFLVSFAYIISYLIYIFSYEMLT